MSNIQGLEDWYNRILEDYNKISIDMPDPTTANEIAFETVRIMDELNSFMFSINKADLKTGETMTQQRDYYYRKIKIMELIHHHAKQKLQEVAKMKIYE